MAAIDKERWQRLSPLLDELLDLAAPERAARLAELRAQDPALAAELLPLLEQQQALEGSNFLAAPPQLLDEVLTRLEPGQQIGAYTLERELGRGGMGTVWLARRTDGRFEGQVAIKLLSNGLFGGSPGEAARFAREGQILARLSHPHIARLLDAGLTDPTRQPYLVLEYVDGAPITNYCEKQQLGLQARVTLFLDVLAAVAHAHNRLILHRDLKPSNIMVDQGGAVKLLDFGIAKLLGDATQAEQGAAATELTRQAGRAFTPQYAAPEQVQGGDVTTATDVYALGVLLYVLLSGGAHPTAGRTKSVEQQASALEQMRELVEVAPRRLSEQAARSEQAAVSASVRLLRGDLDTIVAKALKKTPGERYANAEALAQDLRRWLAHEPISARPDSRLYVLGRFLRRHRLAVGAGSAAVIAIAAGAGIAVWQAKEAHEQRVQAEGLIEFMLGDLRKKLDPVGRLDVLDAVGEKALAYYSRQDLGRSDADALGRRARALHLMGEIAEKRGKMSEAEQRFHEAAETTAELLARDPKNTQRLFDHAQSSYWVGYAAWRQGKREVAQPRFEDYLRLAQTLVQLEPGKAEWQVEVASAENNLGVLLLRSNEAQPSLARFERARATWQELLPTRPELSADLAKTLGWLAEAQEKLGLFEDSIGSQQSKLRALNTASKNDRITQDLEATTLAALSRLQLNLGRGEEALRSAQAVRETYDSLARVAPDNLEIQAKLGFAQVQLAETAEMLAMPLLARQETDALAAVSARLLAADPHKPAWAIRLRGRELAARMRLALAHHGGLREERGRLLQFLTDQSDATKLNRGLDPESRWVLALASLRLGDAWAGESTEQARAQYHAALQHLAPLLEGSPEPRVKSLRAHALLRLGRAQEARGLAESLEASAYRHPEWQAELARRLAVASEKSTSPTIISP